MTILVSACLLGISCRYDGESRPDNRILELAKTHTLIPVCPEQLGGLPTPRTPSEYDGKTVVNQKGEDVTDNFKRGALEILRIARLVSPDLIILKDNSPSCGCGRRYDGSFTKKLTNGDGLTAEILKAENFPVYSCDDYFDNIKSVESYQRSLS